MYNVLGIKNMQKKTKTICKALRETGCRRQAGKRKTCVAGHFFATERGRGTDHHHTGGVPASHQQGSDPAGLFHNQRLAPGEELTPTELQILHLLCADKSNAEIAQIMDVKLPTVKTHVSHILTKLDVKRRAEAKTAAKKLHLVPEEL